MHEEGSPDWRRVNPTDKLHPSTEITVPDLKEGKKCKFKIYAVNAAGNSEPARTGDILVQDILSKSHTEIIWVPQPQQSGDMSLVLQMVVVNAFK